MTPDFSFRLSWWFSLLTWTLVRHNHHVQTSPRPKLEQGCSGCGISTTYVQCLWRELGRIIIRQAAGCMQAGYLLPPGLQRGHNFGSSQCWMGGGSDGLRCQIRAPGIMCHTFVCQVIPTRFGRHHHFFAASKSVDLKCQAWLNPST